MLEPVGPLPASVYWRLRALALAGVLAVILLLWAVWPGGDGGEKRNASATTGTASPTPGEIAATPPANDPGRAAEPTDADSGASSSGSGAGSGAGSASSSGSGTPPATTKPAPPPARPPGPCSARQLSLRVAPASPAYAVGTQPKLTLSVRNASRTACTRDLGAAQQEIRLYRGTTRLWSSNDCYPEGERLLRTLRPGETVTSSITWSGLSSRPGCAGVRTRVPAGTYDLVGKLATLVSPHAKITLRA